MTFSHEKAPAAGQAAVGESRETERLLAVEQRLEAIETKLQRLLDYLDVPAAPDASASTAATQATPPAIARMEGGGTRPTLDTLEKIASAVGADLVVGVGENLSANRSIAKLERDGHAVVRRAS